MADARLLRVIATAGASYVGRFGAGLVILLTVPMARRTLDSELFGAWMMLTALLGFFAFADLGVGNGVLNRVTQARASNDHKRMQQVIGSGYVCTISVAVLLLLAWCAFVGFSANPVVVAGRISAAHHAEVLAALDTFAVLLVINIPASLVQKAQLGAQHGHWIGITQLVSAAVSLVAVPTILHFNGPLFALIFATLGAQVAANVGSTILWLRRNRVFRDTTLRQLVDATTVVQLLRTGSQFFALQLAVAFAFQSDAIVITQRIGQSAYGDFSIVQKLFLFVSMILSSALLGLWPAFGDAIARGDRKWAQRVLVRSLLVAGAFASCAAFALASSMEWITTHWLQSAFAPPLSLCVALGVWTVMDALGAVSGVFMNGANLVRIQILFAVAMGAIAFAGKWFLTPVYGATGAVVATILAYGLVSVPGQIYIYRKFFATWK